MEPKQIYPNLSIRVWFKLLKGNFNLLKDRYSICENVFNTISLSLIKSRKSYKSHMEEPLASDVTQKMKKLRVTYSSSEIMPTLPVFIPELVECFWDNIQALADKLPESRIPYELDIANYDIKDPSGFGIKNWIEAIQRVGTQLNGIETKVHIVQAFGSENNFWPESIVQKPIAKNREGYETYDNPEVYHPFSNNCYAYSKRNFFGVDKGAEINIVVAALFPHRFLSHELCHGILQSSRYIQTPLQLGEYLCIMRVMDEYTNHLNPLRLIREVAAHIQDIKPGSMQLDPVRDIHFRLIAILELCDYFTYYKEDSLSDKAVQDQLKSQLLKAVGQCVKNNTCSSNSPVISNLMNEIEHFPWQEIDDRLTSTFDKFNSTVDSNSEVLEKYEEI